MADSKELKLSKEIALLERKLKRLKSAQNKSVLQKLIDKKKLELKNLPLTAKQVANNLFRAREKVLALASKDFYELLRQLMKKPEYKFLRNMSKPAIRRDMKRKAKPVGWRFKGRGNYKVPNKTDIAKGKRDGSVYYETRPNRSDVSLVPQLGEGGIISEGDMVLVKDKSRNMKVTDITKNSKGQMEFKGKFGSYLIGDITKVSMEGYADSQFGKLDTEWAETGRKPKGYDKAKQDWIDSGGMIYKDGGKTEEPEVVRYYFEDDAYEYEDGGKTEEPQIVRYYFEDDGYEYGKGGIISVGDKVTIPKSKKRMTVENISKNAKGQIEFKGKAGTYLIGDIKKFGKGGCTYEKGGACYMSGGHIIHDIDDKAKLYFLQRLQDGAIDKLPNNPTEEYLKIQMKQEKLKKKYESGGKTDDWIQEATNESILKVNTIKVVKWNKPYKSIMILQNNVEQIIQPQNIGVGIMMVLYL